MSQSYDVLSSQANIAGYRSVIEASANFPSFFAGQMTAAGKVQPAKILVLGVGVAGLAAIQTARNMGAIVRAFDVRPVTKEQVESMGATFLTVPFTEDGSGDGGYAKEMSDGFKAAQGKMMLEQAGKNARREWAARAGGSKRPAQNYRLKTTASKLPPQNDRLKTTDSSAVLATLHFTPPPPVHMYVAPPNTTYQPRWMSSSRRRSFRAARRPFSSRRTCWTR